MSSDSRSTQISILWVLFLVGMTMHMLLAMIPLFAGESIATDEMTAQQVPGMTWMMTFICIVPMVLACLVLMMHSNAFRWVNFVLAAIYVLLNVYHWIAHLGMAGEAPYQVLLLLVVIIMSAILAGVSWKWLKEPEEEEEELEL